MKKYFILLALFSAATFAKEPSKTIDTEFVTEVYEYCFGMQSKDYLNRELLLECINLELKHYEHVQFKTIEEIELIALEKTNPERD